jgi:hypothetical protein
VTVVSDRQWGIS